MAGWWHLLGVYVVAGVFAGVIGWRLLKADAPPGVAYVTFASFAGVMLLYLLIDTGRLADIPALRLGNALYRLEQVERQVRNLQTSLMGYETEEFPPGSYEVTGTPQDRRHPFRITFALKHSAVPDSVWASRMTLQFRPSASTWKTSALRCARL